MLLGDIYFSVLVLFLIWRCFSVLHQRCQYLLSIWSFTCFIDNSWPRGGVDKAPPSLPRNNRRQRGRKRHIRAARHSSYGHWRQGWFSYGARGTLGLSRVLVLNDVMPEARAIGTKSVVLLQFNHQFSSHMRPKPFERFRHIHIYTV